MGLFPLRLSRRVEIRSRVERELEALTGERIAPRVLQKGERVEFLDFPRAGVWLVDTRHGRVLLAAESLRPCR